MVNLFDIPTEKKKVQHKGKIIISNGIYAKGVEDYKTKEDIGGREFISVHFEGFNEGSSCGYLTEHEAQREVQKIKKKKEESGEYSRVEIIDERSLAKRFNPMLNEWKKFIQKLCDDKGEEVEMWFDTSAPMDCEINVRLKSHRCSYNCVSFRFENGTLDAYDSHFGGGTTICDKMMSRVDEIHYITDVMDKVFKKECSNSSWEEDSEGKSYPKREHRVNEFGWLIDKGLRDDEIADVPRDENGWIIDDN